MLVEILSLQSDFMMQVTGCEPHRVLAVENTPSKENYFYVSNTHPADYLELIMYSNELASVEVEMEKHFSL